MKMVDKMINEITDAVNDYKAGLLTEEEMLVKIYGKVSCRMTDILNKAKNVIDLFEGIVK